MFSKSQIKLITSLGQKKYRARHKLFLAEGIKVITELLRSELELHTLFTIEAIFETDPQKTVQVTQAELKKISQLKTTQSALAVFHIPEDTPSEPKGLSVALDGIRDPGNLGTIIRLCDWFGVEKLYCSPDTVDCYNPKVVQASMGSIARVGIHYLNLEELLKEQNELSVFGAFMEGQNVYLSPLPQEGIVVLGNEANGISPEIEKLLTSKISIPQFGGVQETESLNVATATAILLSEFRRTTIGR